MSTDQKNPNSPSPGLPVHRGVKIFTYPKIIFILPTLIASLICGFGMLVIRDEVQDPTRQIVVAETKPEAAPGDAKAEESPAKAVKVRRFNSTQNILGMIFLCTFALNLLIMAIDFPRFTVLAILLTIVAASFFLLWLNVYFDLLPPVVNFLERIYAVANAGFYFSLSAILLVIYFIIWITRYLDYYEILPNEILHNHGPFSDLERFPTFNLKFDKEIPDILEYALLRSGRLVLHVANERKAIVLDNVLWIESKEAELKKLMSRLDVRVTSDQEAAGGI